MDYIKSSFESKSRLSIPEFSDSHCTCNQYNIVQRYVQCTYSDGFVYICIVKVGIDEDPCNGSMCNSEVISPSFFGRPFSAGALQQSR